MFFYFSLRGKAVDTNQPAHMTNNVNNLNFRGRNKYIESIRNRLGKNRNYRTPHKRSLSKSPTIKYEIQIMCFIYFCIHKTIISITKINKFNFNYFD